jgi:protocatechuate 3,4-dioxygenase, beta subunit
MDVSRRMALVQIGSGALLAPATAVAAIAPTQPLTMGPFYPLSKPSDHDADLTQVSGHSKRAQGQVIEVSGRVLNLRGESVPNARIEIWQANAAGRYRHPSDTSTAPLDPNFQGYALLRADAVGRYRYLTVKPGAYPGGRRGMRTPHIHLQIDGRFNRLVTQMFFPGEPLNATDVILQDAINPAEVTATARGRSADGLECFEWDIVLQSG